MSSNQAMVDGLNKLLANTYILYLKTQNFHWNVTGPAFYSLHGLFQMQYEELAAAIDEIAERIRALGHVALGSFAQYGKLSVITEAEQMSSSGEMLQQLIHDQSSIVSITTEVLKHAEAEADQATIDLLTRRLLAHEKNAWMLRSSVG